MPGAPPFASPADIVPSTLTSGTENISGAATDLSGLGSTASGTSTSTSGRSGLTSLVTGGIDTSVGTGGLLGNAAGDFSSSVGAGIGALASILGNSIAGDTASSVFSAGLLSGGIGALVPPLFSIFGGGPSNFDLVRSEDARVLQGRLQTAIVGLTSATTPSEIAKVLIDQGFNRKNGNEFYDYATLTSILRDEPQNLNVLAGSFH